MDDNAVGALNITSLASLAPNQLDNPIDREIRIRLYTKRAAEKRCIFTGVKHGFNYQKHDDSDCDN